MDAKANELVIALALVIVSILLDSAETTNFQIKPSINNDGYIKSPGYPYEHSTSCSTWSYHGRPGLQIKITFMDLDIPSYTELCNDGFVRIGLISEQFYCGSIDKRNLEPYVAVMTTVHQDLEIIYCGTAGERKGRGFKIYYQFNDLGDATTSSSSGPPLPYDISSCHFWFYSATGESGTNSTVLDCINRFGMATWQLHHSDPNMFDAKYRITFRSCILPYGAVLNIYDGITSGDLMLGRYTEGHCPTSLLSLHNQVFIEYHSEGAVSSPDFTFTFEMISVPTTEISRPMFSDHPTSQGTNKCSFEFTSSSGMITREYFYDILQNSGCCSWLLHDTTLDRGQVTYSLTIDKLHVSPGTVFTVYDGQNSTSSALFSHQYSLGTSSITFESTQSKVLISYNPGTSSKYMKKDDTFIISYTKLVSSCVTHHPCGYGEYGCYLDQGRCDGLWDCPLHGGDERSCSDECPGSFRCSYDSYTCFNESNRCDGRSTCSNHADEMGCSEDKCSSTNGLFLCNDKRCIYESWMCDGRKDCLDGSDEQGCSLSSSPRIVIAAVVSCISCGLLLVIAAGCVCKAHGMRFNRLHRGLHETPLSRQLAEMFHRRAPPPPYHEAMLTSRPYIDLHEEPTGVSNNSYQENADEGPVVGDAPRRSRPDNRRGRRSSQSQNPPPEYRLESSGEWEVGMLHLFPEDDVLPQHTLDSSTTGNQGHSYNDTDHPHREAIRDNDFNVQPRYNELWLDGGLSTSRSQIQMEIISPNSVSIPAHSLLRSDSNGSRMLQQGHQDESIGQRNVDEDAKSASTSLSDVSDQALLPGDEEDEDKIREDLNCIDEDSDTECILEIEDNNVDNDDSSSSDTTCILHHM